MGWASRGSCQPPSFIKQVGVAASNVLMGAATTRLLAVKAQTPLTQRQRRAGGKGGAALHYSREKIPIIDSEYFITYLSYTYIFFYARNITF